MTGILHSLLSPMSLAFLIIALGVSIGRLKLFKISLDISAVLLLSVAVGYIISYMGLITDAEKLAEMTSYMNVFSSLGTSVFVSLIGISSGYSLNSRGKMKIQSMLVGAVMVISSFALMGIIKLLGTRLSYSALLGILCGALTTTPGLASVCEKAGIMAQDASLGYGSAYLLGVIFTVLSVQFITRKTEMKKSVVEPISASSGASMYLSFLQLAIVIVGGRMIGGIVFPIADISLGNSGGILILGIVVGALVKKYAPHMCVPSILQGFARSFGLSLFFVGNGVMAGMQFNEGFNIFGILIGVLLTLLPILVGWIICRFIFGKSDCDTAAVIAGGMTSTPAFCIISDKEGINGDVYSFAYVGALISVILLVRLC